MARTEWFVYGILLAEILLDGGPTGKFIYFQF